MPRRAQDESHDLALMPLHSLIERRRQFIYWRSGHSPCITLDRRIRESGNFWDQMNPMATIGVWATLFVLSHLVISSNAIRPALVSRIGAQPYRGIYSLVAFATFIPLVIVFARHKHAGPVLWYLRSEDPVRWLAWALMLFALILFAGSFINPNPGAIGAGSGVKVGGILKITRHPSFVAIALFAIAHLLMNGWGGDVLFFGSIGILAIFGGMHQDRRKLHELGAPYRTLLDQTSFFPGAALIRGRAHWRSSDMPWAAIGIGAAATVVIVMFHPMLFGGRPLG
jgi:uncharacterized membrane protein